MRLQDIRIFAISLALAALALAGVKALDESVPNHRGVVEDVARSGHYDLLTHEGRAAFVDAAVEALHKKDKRWGHLKKNPSQTNIHRHAEDAALYLRDTGLSSAVDFGGGFGGPNPTIAWQVDIPRYTKADWLDPHEHDAWANPPALAPATKPYPGDEFFTKSLGEVLERDYAEAGQRLNAGSSVWFSRTIWRHVNEGMTMEQSTAQSRKEWRAALGLPQ